MMILIICTRYEDYPSIGMSSKFYRYIQYLTFSFFLSLFSFLSFSISISFSHTHTHSLTHTHILQVNLCTYYSKGVADYVGIWDFDEFFIPKGENKNLLDVIKNVYRPPIIPTISVDLKNVKNDSDKPKNLRNSDNEIVELDSSKNDNNEKYVSLIKRRKMLATNDGGVWAAGYAHPPCFFLLK